MAIINLTQHAATADQLAAHIVDVNPSRLEALKTLLTFPAVYNTALLKERANAIAKLAWAEWDEQCQTAANADERPLSCTDDEYQNYWYHNAKECMIGGMPSFMKHLEKALRNEGFCVGFACSDRVSVDVPDGNGGVRKTAVFKHVGIYWAE